MKTVSEINSAKITRDHKAFNDYLGLLLHFVPESLKKIVDPESITHFIAIEGSCELIAYSEEHELMRLKLGPQDDEGADNE